MRSLLPDVIRGLACDYADIRVEQSERCRIVFRRREVDVVDRALDQGGCIRAFHRGNWGVATFNCVDERLDELARDTARRAEELPPQDIVLTSLGSREDSIRIPRSRDPRLVPFEAKHALISHYNDILLETPGVVSTAATYLDAWRRTDFCSSEGRRIDQESAHTGFSCQVYVRDGTNIQDYEDSFGKAQGFDSLRDREPVVERIGRIALDLLKAGPVPAGTYTVVVDPSLAGVLVHEAFGHLSEADYMASDERLRELVKPGTRFGGDALTIVDDATLPGERGSYVYDDEGVPGQRTDLVKHGVLTGRLHDRRSAAQMQDVPTGNGRALSYRFAPAVRMSNTFIEPDEANLDDMMEETESGLYVSGSRGGMTELETFTFSPQYAWVIEHGRRTRMVRDAMLTGNVFRTLANIDMIGDDLTLFGGIGGCTKAGQGPLPVGFGSPHLRIRDVTVGGR